jgi:Zn finger protein HypA/HybF involved in hydrogenase expression
MRESDIVCKYKHTTYQPKDSEWLCPKCGKGNEFFYIEESFSEGECILLHDEDYIVCTSCGKGITGKKFASLLEKKNNLIKCPCCKGTGLVVKGTI